jgi:hypothetical protein
MTIAGETIGPVLTKPTRQTRRRKATTTKLLPYEGATTGKKALAEMEKTLRTFGATSLGAMENFDTEELIVQFTWRDRDVTIRASGKGYAALWMKRHRWSSREFRHNYERRALEKGKVARYSILRDWIKGQVTAVECGIMSFDAAFLGYIMLPSGETVMEHIDQQKLLALPPPTH